MMNKDMPILLFTIHLNQIDRTLLQIQLQAVMNYKKKTQHLINLRTNNFIEAEIEKEVFFNEVLEELRKCFEAEHYEFLMSHILPSNNPNLNKKGNLAKDELSKKSNCSGTSKRLHTEPLEERKFQLSDIDVNIFQQELNPRQSIRGPDLTKMNLKNRQSDVSIKGVRKESKQHFRPEKVNRRLFFPNKKILDIDKRLSQKYSQIRKVVLQPGSLFQRTRPVELKFEISYSKPLQQIKSNPIDLAKNCLRDNKAKRIQTQASQRQESEDKLNNVTETKQIKGLFKENIRSSEDYPKLNLNVPSDFMSRALASRRKKLSQSPNRMFSDFGLNSSYKACFR